MRSKSLLNFFPAPRRAIKHAYSAIALTRYTTAYFIALLLSIVTLSSLQLSSYVTNRHADIMLSNIIKAASVQGNLIPIVSSQDGQGVLQLCNGIPSSLQDVRCQTVYAPTATTTPTQPPANLGADPSTSQESVPTTTPTQVSKQAQTLVSTTSTESNGNPGLLIAAQPTSTSVSHHSPKPAHIDFSSVTGLLIADIPTSTTTTLIATGNAVSVVSTTTSRDLGTTSATEAPNRLNTEETTSTSTSSPSVETDILTASQDVTDTLSESTSNVGPTTRTSANATSTAHEVETSGTTREAKQETSTSVDEPITSSSSILSKHKNKTSSLSTSTKESASTSNTSEDATASSTSDTGEEVAASSTSNTSQDVTASSTSHTSQDITASSTSNASQDVTASSTSNAGQDVTASFTSSTSQDVSASSTSDAGQDVTASFTSDAGQDVTASFTSSTSQDVSASSTSYTSRDITASSTSNPSQDVTTSSTSNAGQDVTASFTSSTSQDVSASFTSNTSQDITASSTSHTSEDITASFTSAVRDSGVVQVSESQSRELGYLSGATATPTPSSITHPEPTSTSPIQSSFRSTSSSSSSDVVTSSASLEHRSRRNFVRQDRMLLRRSFDTTPVINSTTGAILGVNVTDIADDGSSDVTFINLRCAQAFLLAEEQLHESWTEDLVMVGYNIWLFGLGAMAILNESIPHLVAAFLSSIFALIWSGSQLTETRGFHDQFNTIINGACNGVDILNVYWSQRGRIGIAIFVINVISVITLGVLGSKLVSVYRRQMTKVTGEEKGAIGRLYKVALIFSTVVQIGAFLLLASLCLWVQQLFISPIAAFSSTTPIFKAVGLLSTLFTIPWFIIGWIAIRREHKVLMVIFLVLNAFFLASWVAIFSSDVYRLTFTTWTFFAAVTIATFFLLVGSLIAGILCRMRFGMGLVAQVEEKSKDELDTTPWEFSNIAEKAWEPFERGSIRQSRFTTISSDRQSTTFSYGLRSPAPPLPVRP